MPRYARAEREALADLMLELGPDAPTVNEGWSTRDLAAHLLVRERRPDAAGGIRPPLRRWLQRRVGPQADRRRAVRRFDRPGAPPPVWSPVSNPLTDELANGMEFFIHHEDVRRARPGWHPRDLPAGQQAMLWKRVSLLARMALRRFPAEVLVQAPGYGELRPALAANGCGWSARRASWCCSSPAGSGWPGSRWTARPTAPSACAPPSWDSDRGVQPVAR
ncbi:TIGR03085 family metal-binding protein [Micromonospora sp. BRA006-A]|nr:TIGR03085 family metal-binding protein [Micromonospora sp. BRA006-A]